MPKLRYQLLMETITALLEPYRAVLPWIAWGSGIAFLLSLAVVPALIARIPVNYFRQPSTVRNSAPKISSVHYPLVWILRNLAGLIFILSGIAMLVLPGQGLLTIVLGIFVADFPGKWALERKLIAQKSVFSTINWIRAKKGVENLAYPDLSAKNE